MVRFLETILWSALSHVDLHLILAIVDIIQSMWPHVAMTNCCLALLRSIIEILSRWKSPKCHIWWTTRRALKLMVSNVVRHAHVRVHSALLRLKMVVLVLILIIHDFILIVIIKLETQNQN